MAEEQTFKAVTEAWLAENSNHWTNRYRAQTQKALKKYIYPSIGYAPIKEVAAPALRVVIKTAAEEAPSVAVMLRQWCSAVFRYAVLQGLAEQDPAAALKGLESVGKGASDGGSVGLVRSDCVLYSTFTHTIAHS